MSIVGLARSSSPTAEKKNNKKYVLCEAGIRVRVRMYSLHFYAWLIHRLEFFQYPYLLCAFECLLNVKYFLQSASHTSWNPWVHPNTITNTHTQAK